MNPSISIRNFVGGLLGGLVGILMAYYLNPLALPFGVLFGVVVGWWHRELLGAFTSARQTSGTMRRDLRHFTNDTIDNVGASLGMPPWAVDLFKWLFIDVPIAIGHIPTALHRLGQRFNAWLRAHPMNKGDLVSRIASIGFAIVFGVGVRVFCLHHGYNADNSLALGAAGIVLGMIGGLAYDTTRETYHFYREWEVLSRYGSVGLSVYVAAACLRLTAGLILFAGFMVMWCVPTMLILLLAIFPLSILLNAYKVFGWIASRDGHWLCFLVTLATTAASWRFFGHRFESEIVVWSVALATGMVSGLLTEVIRLPFAAFCSNSKMGAWLKRCYILDTPIGFQGKGSVYLTFAFVHIVGFFVSSQNRLVRMFRAICFATPVARPVVIV